MWNLGIIGVLLGTESLEVGLNTLSKAAMRSGMSNLIFVLYQNALAILFLAPLTFIYHRIRSPPPRLTFSILCRIILIGIVGGCLQVFTFTGIRLSSPTLASAMSNLTPAYTFILGGVTRMEKINLKMKSSQMKSVGTIVSIIGAFVVTFYKGPAIIFAPSHSTSLNDQLLQSPRSNWVIGGFLLSAASFLISVLFIVQTWVMKDYPAELMVSLISCIFATIQTAIIALFMERNPSAWRIRPDIELVTIVYSAIFVISLRNVVYSWALHKKGPLFVTMIKPVGMVIAIVMGTTFLGDTLYIGSVIGAVIIALGFYSVMWGKTEEEKIVEDNSLCDIDACTDKVPLLQTKGMVV
ncbi:WAT1-related protein At3g28050-like [Cornus florida]|uniref:WAT1-related protein At3g28050-like n=1 Tax=Cornus florida TaxID=4283 RepID=UPI00289AD070|nr:WAT1-related protein At3g28050-like [Cornus florida]